MTKKMCDNAAEETHPFCELFKNKTFSSGERDCEK